MSSKGVKQERIVDGLYSRRLHEEDLRSRPLGPSQYISVQCLLFFCPLYLLFMPSWVLGELAPELHPRWQRSQHIMPRISLIHHVQPWAGLYTRLQVYLSDELSRDP